MAREIEVYVRLCERYYDSDQPFDLGNVGGSEATLRLKGRTWREIYDMLKQQGAELMSEEEIDRQHWRERILKYMREAPK